MAASPSLSVALEGPDRDKGAVALAELQTFLKDLTECLGVVQKRIAGTAKVRHLVTDLKVSSAIIETSAVSPKDSPEVGRNVYDMFRKTVTALDNDEIENVDKRFTSEDLKAFRKLAAPVLKGRKVRIGKVQLSTQFVATIDKLLGTETKSKGTLKGRAERWDIHNRHQFTLFPPIGNVAVVCTYDPSLSERVREAMEKSVTIAGTLSFRGDSAYPERVQVESIDIHPPDDELPTLRSLRGLMPNGTGGKSSVEFIRAQRDEQ